MKWVLVLCWILINLYTEVLPIAGGGSFSSLLDIDKLILMRALKNLPFGFSSLLDIVKLFLLPSRIFRLRVEYILLEIFLTGAMIKVIAEKGIPV